MRGTITIMAALLLLLGAGSGLAITDYSKPGGSADRGGQRGQHRPMLPDSTQIERMLDELDATLGLDETQRARISDLTFDHFAQAAEKMAGAGARAGLPREEMEALRKDYEDDVKALLDDEQKAAFDDFLKSRRPPRQQPGPRGQR